MTEYKGYSVNEIRFLPMGKNVFDTFEEVSHFILNTLPKRGGTYYYKKSKMNCAASTLVLFQYDGQLIGSAIYLATVQLEIPLLMDDGHLYNGYYQFAPESIQLFTEPIYASDFKNIDPSFTRFGQGAKIIDLEYLNPIINLIDGNKNPIKIDVAITIPEEVSTLMEGAKKTITVNAYERNPQARTLCISHYRAKNNGRIKCEICDFDFGKIYGEEFSEKIHIHHIKEISSIGEEYEVDAIADLLPVCPNCHMIAHSKTPAYTPDEIREMIGKTKNGE